MFIKALVRKLHLKVFSPGDFAMEEGESGEEVDRGVARWGGRAGPPPITPSRLTTLNGASTLHTFNARSTFSRAALSQSSRKSTRWCLGLLRPLTPCLRATTSSYPMP